jgi:outer membrane receptor protein involved in Fe transport
MSRFTLCMTVSVALLSGRVWAQSEIGGATLNGTVTDPSGAAVTGAKVTATQTATGFTRSTESNTSGFYSFTALRSGPYEVSVEAQGFKAAKLTSISLTVGAVATLDVHLVIGATTETVNVTSEVPLVETSRSGTSTVVNASSVDGLPVNGRNFLEFQLTTPGVVRDPTRSGDISFGGQRGTSNSLQVDGSDANNTFFGQSTGRAGTGRSPYSFSQDAVQEFQVSTNGFSADIGRAGGGVLNVITKSGTNAFHGTAFEFFRDRAMNANTWINNQRNIRKGAYHFNQFGGNIGGPIAKNKLFFFFDYDGQRNTSPVTVIPGVAAPSDALSQQGFALLQPFLSAYAQGLNNDVYLGKVDWNIGQKQRLSVRYNANRFTGVNFENGGQTSVQAHTGNSSVSTDNISGTHTLLLTSRSILESRLTYTRDDEPGAANSTDPEALIQQGGSTALFIGRNSFSPRYTNAKTTQWAESYSMTRGRHNYKLGFDMNFQRIGNFFPGNFSGAFTFTSYANFAQKIPITFTQAFAGAGTNGPLSEPNVGEYAFYVQDSWRIFDRLTLNYGVRYDFFNLGQPLVKNPDAGLAALGLDTSRINLDHNNLAPRFGFAYRLDQSGRTAMRGGYGIFYGRTPSILTGTAITQNGIQVQTYTLTSGIPTYPNLLSAPPALSRTPDIYVFAKDYVQPLTHQWDFNLERQLGKDYLVTVGYLGVRGQHLTRTRDINWLPEVPLAGTLSTGGAVTFYRHPGRVNPAFGRISLFDSGADSIYHGGFAQLTKRLGQNFQVQTSFTLSKVIDSNPDFTSVVVGTDDAKNAQDTLNPNGERGRGNADIRKKFVFSGLWNIEYGKSLHNPVLRAVLSGYELSTIATGLSGRPYTITVGGDPNGDTNTRSDRPPGLGRNTLNGPAFASVDMRFTRDIRLFSEKAGLKLIFEAFNLTNRANYSAINTAQFNYTNATRVFTPNASFLQRTATFDPRILQVAAKITF